MTTLATQLTVDVDGFSISTHNDEQDALDEARREAGRTRDPVEVSRWEYPTFTAPPASSPICVERRRVLSSTLPICQGAQRQTESCTP